MSVPDTWGVAQWLREAHMKAACELVIVPDFDKTLPILLCMEPAHSREMHKRDLALPFPQVKEYLEFDHRELALLAPILEQLLPSERVRFRNQVLALKKQFGGRAISEEQYRRLDAARVVLHVMTEASAKKPSFAERLASIAKMAKETKS